MEDQWLLSAIFDDDLVGKIRKSRSNSSRYTSINLPTVEDEMLSSSSGSRITDDDICQRSADETNTMKMVPRRHLNLVPKPIPSSDGRPLALFTNHFQIHCRGPPVYQYHVKISPDIPSKKLNRKIVQLLKNQQPILQEAMIVYDGWHTVYSTKRINLKTINTVVVTVNGMLNTRESPNTFQVTFEYVDSFSLDTNIASLQQGQDPSHKLKVMNAIDTILRQTSCGRFHVVLQSFFSITPQRSLEPSRGLGWGTVNLGLGREVCYGFYQNVMETFDALTLNLDVATTTFYRPVALVEFLAEVLEVPVETVRDGRTLSEHQKKKFSKEVAGLKIETRHCNAVRRFRVTRCTSKPMDSLTVNLARGIEEKKVVTLAQYYKLRYNIDLKYRHLPCLEVGRSRECLLPLELCFIVSGQRCIKKLNEQQIANLIKATSRNALERNDAIMKLRNRVGLDTDEHAANFGLEVDARMMQMKGRVLPAPRLLYGSPFSNQQVCVATPNNGTWDMRGKNFYTGVKIYRWAIVCFAPSAIVIPTTIQHFVINLQKVAKEIGMPFIKNHNFCRYAQPDQAVKILEHLHEELPDLQLIICIVPGKSAIYGDLKRKGDMLGLTTQCVRTHNVTKISPHTLSNLCMKINSKLGGINVVLSSPPRTMTDEPVLFIGCHLSRNSVLSSSGDSSSSSINTETSVACLVGSMDGHPTRFSPIFRTQPRHLNTIVDMREMVREAIVNFRCSTGFKPHKIIVYRSGISDGTIDEILQTELRGIREACAIIEKGYQPGITFIGLDVTHHTRLFATIPTDRVGNSQNVPAGTLVETGITVNNLFEFYLVSHAGIQGTSRPTKYVVMWDDNRMPSADIHEMTYQLCHTQSRCTRSVSIPSPVYYAKLVAQRAKILMAEDNFSIDNFREITRHCEGMLFT